MQPVAMPFIYKFCIIYAISVNAVIIVYNLRISEETFLTLEQILIILLQI